MAYHGVFRELPLSATRASGWLEQSLERLRDGLTGHLEAAGYPFDTVSWHGDESVNRCPFLWEPYEQTGYWVDGMLRCGMLLRDDALIAKARRSLDHVLRNPGVNDYLGPKGMRVRPPEHREDTSKLAHYKWRWRWPHAVLFRAFMALGDEPEVPAALRAHFNGDADYDYADGRDVLNLEAAHWTAQQLGDSDLHERASDWFAQHDSRFPASRSSLAFQLSDQRDIQHGVTFNEMAKLGAIEYLYTGNVTCLRASENAYRKIDRDQMLVDGICSSSEHLRGKDPLDSHETCDIADFLWSVGYLLMATGDARYADKMERALFNAGYGAITPDARALQYFSCPNQVVCDRHSNHNEMFRGRTHMSYRPNPGTPCCPGDVNRVVPGFASRMWLDDGQGGVAAALYAPGILEGRLGAEAQPVRISQQSNYPFEEKVVFSVATDKPVAFTFHVRIPGWCAKPALRINGAKVQGRLWAGSFVPITRTFHDGDVIELDLPMECRLTRWPRAGVAVERGPLVYALRIDEKWERDQQDAHSTTDMPAWNIYPASRWNFGVAPEQDELDTQVVLHKRETHGAYPWSPEGAPLELELTGYTLDGWQLEQHDAVSRTLGNGTDVASTEEVGQFIMTPQLPPVCERAAMVGKPERIRLIPYGCTQLRLTVFPEVVPETAQLSAT